MSFLSGLSGALGGEKMSTAAGNFLGGAFNSVSDGFMNLLFGGLKAKRDQKYFDQRLQSQKAIQTELMDKQFDQQMQFWHEQNDYNDPSAVVERYRKAGISPLAAFGGQAVGQGASSVSMPSISAPSGGSVGSAEPNLISPVESSLIGAKVKNTDSDTKQKDVNTQLLEEKVISEQLFHRIEEVNARVAEYTEQNQKDMSDEELRARRTDIAKTEQEIQAILQDMAESASRIRNNEKQYELLQQSINEKIEQVAILRIQKDYVGGESEARIQQMLANANYLMHMAEQSESYKNYVDKLAISEDDKHKLNEALHDYRVTIEKAKAHKEERGTSKIADLCYTTGQFAGTISNLLQPIHEALDIEGKFVDNLNGKMDFIGSFKDLVFPKLSNKKKYQRTRSRYNKDGDPIGYDE